MALQLFEDRVVAAQLIHLVLGSPHQAVAVAEAFRVGYRHIDTAQLFRLGQGRVIWNIRQSLYDLSLEKRGSAMVIKSLKWLAPLAEVITYNSQLSARQHEAIGYSQAKTRLIPRLRAANRIEMPCLRLRLSVCVNAPS